MRTINTLQLTQRRHQKPTYQVELVSRDRITTRMLVSPRFDRIRFAKDTFDELLVKAQDATFRWQLLTDPQQTYAVKPTIIHKAKRIP